MFPRSGSIIRRLLERTDLACELAIADHAGDFNVSRVNFSSCADLRDRTLTHPFYIRLGSQRVICGKAISSPSTAISTRMNGIRPRKMVPSGTFVCAEAT